MSWRTTSGGYEDHACLLNAVEEELLWIVRVWLWFAVNNPIQESRILLYESIYCYTLGASHMSDPEPLPPEVIL